MTIDLKALRELCDAAGAVSCLCGLPHCKACLAHDYFKIAADPATVRELIERVERAEADRDVAESRRSQVFQGLQQRAEKADVEVLRMDALVTEYRERAAKVEAELVAAREKALEECKALILGGLLLSDEAPTRKFAHGVADAIDRLATKGKV